MDLYTSFVDSTIQSWRYLDLMINIPQSSEIIMELWVWSIGDLTNPPDIKFRVLCISMGKHVSVRWPCWSYMNRASISKCARWQQWQTYCGNNQNIEVRWEAEFIHLNVNLGNSSSWNARQRTPTVHRQENLRRNVCGWFKTPPT